MIISNNMNDYVTYLGRTVLRENFRTYVYGQDSQKKLVNSWNQFQEAIGSGLWHAEKQLPLKPRKKERVTDGTDS